MHWSVKNYLPCGLSFYDRNKKNICHAFSIFLSAIRPVYLILKMLLSFWMCKQPFTIPHQRVYKHFAVIVSFTILLCCVSFYKSHIVFGSTFFDKGNLCGLGLTLHFQMHDAFPQFLFVLLKPIIHYCPYHGIPWILKSPRFSFPFFGHHMPFFSLVWSLCLWYIS